MEMEHEMPCYYTRHHCLLLTRPICGRHASVYLHKGKAEPYSQLCTKKVAATGIKDDTVRL